MVFTLPYLEVKRDDRIDPGLNLGLEGIEIVPGDDERVNEIVSWSPAAETWLNSFETHLGHKIIPAVLIVRRDWMKRLGKDPEPIVAFRNAVALSNVMICRARGPERSFIGAPWSDAFDFHASQLTVDGGRVDVSTPAVSSFGVPLDSLRIALDPAFPRRRFGLSDDYLAVWLGRLWKDRYLRRRRIRKTAAVFRSLELAYHAASVQFKNYGSIHDAGLSSVLWVSAVETLASHGRKGNVGKAACLDLLADPPKIKESALLARWYRVVVNRRPRQVNVAQKIYDLTYRARNKFVHGDQVSPSLLLPFAKKRGPPLLELATTIYRMCLVRHLMTIESGKWKPDWRMGMFTHYEYEKHLLRAQGKARRRHEPND